MVSFQVLAPLSGQVVPLEQLPDPVFQQRLLGDGLAILPTEGRLLAPLAGQVAALFPTGHALGMTGPHGVELLLHIGIESVWIEGLFTPLVASGQAVEPGQELVRFDLDRLVREAASPLSPIVAVQMPPGGRLCPTAAGLVRAGIDPLFTIEWGEL